ncbi:MAG: SprT-like domain-containing protein [Campylobacteraceae bacterium]|jgi:SprT protein|nr:SprT-like domain-containing protein [Campylobacteraceae bacterium]
MDFLSCFLGRLKQKANFHYGLSLSIELAFDLKGFRLIGQCKKLSSKNYLIRLHAKLLHEFNKIYIKDVLTHEFAHAVQMELFSKSKPHSKEWKHIVEILSGVQYAKRYKASYNLTNNRKYKTYPYSCSCREYQLTSVRHNKVIKNMMVYVCKKCNEILKFDG